MGASVIGVALAVVAAAAVWWLFLSAPSAARIEALRQGFLNGDPGPALAAIPARFRVEVLFQMMRDFLLDDAFDAGKRALAELARIDPVIATGHAELLATSTGDTDFAVRVCERALEVRPNSVSALGALARILAAAGRTGEALAVLARRPDEPDLLEIRADLLLADGQLDEALEIAGSLEAFGSANRGRLLDAEELARAERLRGVGASVRREVRAELDEGFDPLRDLAKSGDLRARSGGNHWVLGHRMRLDATPDDRALVHPTRLGNPALDALARDPDDLRALLAAGESCLRSKDPVRAVEHLSRAVRLDPTDFAAQIGLGAALRCSEERWLAQLGALPEASVPSPQGFPDLPALFDDEQRVVTASVGELAPWLSRPIRIRPLPWVPGPADPPSVDAADLYDLSEHSGWQLARCVAFEAWEALPDAARVTMAAVLDEVRDRPELSVVSDLDDLDALFVEGWVRLLCVRWLDAPPDALTAGIERVLSAR
ncbi:MAG: tetratricopeptide repeat protein [Myxococcota bacterium]